MAHSLTPKEYECLVFVTAFIEVNTYGPSFEEIMAGVSLKSKSGVHRLLTALEDRGHIHRLSKRARAITLGPAPLPRRCPNCFTVLRAA